MVFVDEKAVIAATLIFSRHWKTMVPFCLQNRIPENTFLTIRVNYCKITQKKNVCCPKQH